MRLAARAVFDRDGVTVTWGASGKVPVGLAPPAPPISAKLRAIALAFPADRERRAEIDEAAIRAHQQALVTVRGVAGGVP